MVRNNFMMHLCTVATLCFLEKTFPRNYYYSDQDDNSLSLCFKSMYLTLFVAIFTSNFIFSMFKSLHTYRNINISNLGQISTWFEKLWQNIQDYDQTWGWWIWAVAKVSMIIEKLPCLAICLNCGLVYLAS